MANNPMSNVLKHLRRAVLLGDGAGLTDGELLEEFVTQRDSACFEALVRRHGPMVLGVCRRVLRNKHDAEDAFQATFLVLVRKAESVVPRELVGNWLYGVAYRTALEAKRAAARRRMRERQVNEMLHPAVEPEECWEELQPLLDRELSLLPDKYRLPVVLCDLEGRTRKEAARQLGLPEGTVSGRLTAARRMLAKRLSRHGLTLSAGVLATVLAQGSAPAGVPSSLTAFTVQAAVLVATGQATAASVVSSPVAALIERMVKILSVAKLKTVTSLLLVASLLGGGGMGLITHHLWGAGHQTTVVHELKPLPPATAMIEMSDQEKLQGTWVAISCECNGEKDFDKDIRKNQLIFDGDRMTYRTIKGQWEAPFRLSAASKPKAINIDRGDDGEMRAIYELEGNRLKFCFSKARSERPTSFEISKESPVSFREIVPTYLYIYEKQHINPG